MTVTCVAGYYDGDQLLISKGVIKGRIVPPRGKNGFGFDIVVQPDGQDKTMAEMTDTEKAKISHRGKAFRSLLKQIEALE